MVKKKEDKPNRNWQMIPEKDITPPILFSLTQDDEGNIVLSASSGNFASDICWLDVADGKLHLMTLLDSEAKAFGVETDGGVIAVES